MLSRERVKRCVEFDNPDRVPRNIWILPIVAIKNGEDKVRAFQQRWLDDIRRADIPIPALEALKEGDPYAVGDSRDEWGCIRENVHAGIIGQVKWPLLEDWSKMDRLRPPVEALDLDIDAVNRFCDASDQFILCDPCPDPFERLQFLRGTENVYMDLADESAELKEALNRISEFYYRELEVWSKTKVDALTFMDDWGSQRSLLISPKQWRRLFKPIYANFVRIAHDAGKKIFMHSDGCIFEIYEDLIEIGVDAINSQLFCMDIEEIGRHFGGRITFWGEIDRQHILPYGTAEDVRNAVRRLANALYRPEGGIIAQCEPGASPLENVEAFFQAWSELT